MKSILIIGGGSIGKRHLKNLLALGEKDITLIEPAPERALTIRNEFGIETAGSLDEAWSKKEFDIGLICSPPIYHLDQAQQLAEKGINFFVEKPLSHTTHGLDKLVELVQKKKLITMVGSNWKFYPSFQTMKELLDAGAIGRVLSARCQFGWYLPNWHPWEDFRKGYSANKKLGGGILLDSHEFDYLTWFLGPVTQLACFADKVSDLEIDVEDTAEVIFKFQSGAIGELHLDYTQRFYQRNFEFFGEKGTIIWDTNWKKIILRLADEPEKEFTLTPEYDINTMYIEEMKHFLECVAENKPTLTPITKAAEVVKLIVAAKESAEKNSVIKIK